MNKYRLPKSILIGDTECEINTDFRDILQIFEILNDPDLLDQEKIIIALDWFYVTDDYLQDLEFAVKEMFAFINAGEPELTTRDLKPLYDWEQDFDIIVAPVNRILGTDVRGLDYLHWWTFLSAFMEIGECTFSTYVSIRDKLNKHKKLEKYEERIYKENRDKIVLKKKYDFTTQALIDEIMGKEG